MMNTKIIKRYVTELSKARVKLSDDPLHPVTFNRADSFPDYQLYLLGLEIELLPLAVEIVLNRKHTVHWRTTIPCSWKIYSGEKELAAFTVTCR